MPESDTGVRDRDHHHTARQFAPPVVRLHRHPAPGARVLHNILTRLRKRHSESILRLRFRSKLEAEVGGGRWLNLLNTRVHASRGGPRVNGSKPSPFPRTLTLRTFP